MPAKPIRRDAIRVVGPSIAYIKLSKGQFSCIDAEDAPRVEYCSWSARWHPHTRSYYAMRMRRVNGRQIHVSLHEEIMGEIEGECRDHHNRSTLDNRKANLRPATFRLNQANRRSSNRTGFKGVQFCPYRTPGQQYVTSKTRGGRRVYLGGQATAEIAHEVYMKAAIEEYGEFAHSGK